MELGSPKGAIKPTPAGIRAVQVHAALTIAIAAPYALGCSYLAFTSGRFLWMVIVVGMVLWALPAAFVVMPRRSSMFKFMGWVTLLFGIPSPLFFSAIFAIVLFASSGRKWFTADESTEPPSSAEKVLLGFQVLVHLPILLSIWAFMFGAVSLEDISTEDFVDDDGVPQLVNMHEGEITTAPVPGRLDFTVFRIDDSGETLSLESLRGEPAVVMFYASWCGTCVRNWPRFSRSDFGGARKVVVATDCMSDGEPNHQAVETMARDGGWDGPIYCSSYEMDGLMSLTYIPTTFVIDANGYPRASFEEVIPSVDLETLERIIPSLEPVSRAPELPAFAGSEFCVVEAKFVEGVKSDVQIGSRIVLGEDFLSQGSDRLPLRWTGVRNATYVARTDAPWAKSLSLAGEFYVAGDTEPRLHFDLAEFALAPVDDARCSSPG